MNRRLARLLSGPWAEVPHLSSDHSITTNGIRVNLTHTARVLAARADYRKFADPEANITTAPTQGPTT